MGSAASGPGQWIKHPALPQLWLGSDPWPGNSRCCRAAKNGEKKKTEKKRMEGKLGSPESYTWQIHSEDWSPDSVSFGTQVVIHLFIHLFIMSRSRC